MVAPPHGGRKNLASTDGLSRRLHDLRQRHEVIALSPQKLPEVLEVDFGLLRCPRRLRLALDAEQLAPVPQQIAPDLERDAPGSLARAGVGARELDGLVELGELGAK